MEKLGTERKRNGQIWPSPPWAAKNMYLPSSGWTFAECSHVPFQSSLLQATYVLFLQPFLIGLAGSSHRTLMHLLSLPPSAIWEQKRGRRVLESKACCSLFLLLQVAQNNAFVWCANTATETTSLRNLEVSFHWLQEPLWSLELFLGVFFN